MLCWNSFFTLGIGGRRQNKENQGSTTAKMKVRLPREQHSKVETKRGSRLPTEKKKNVAASGSTRPSNSIVRFVCGFTPVPLPDIKPDIEKPNPRMGPGIVGWSYDGQFVVSRFILLSIPTNCSIMMKSVHRLFCLLVPGMTICLMDCGFGILLV
jgi:hypothetical protein